MSNMKVYVVGAIAEPGDPLYADADQFKKIQDEFAGACSALGAALVRAGHTIYIDIPSWNRLRSGTTAVSYIVKGVKSEKISSKAYEIVLYQPKETEPTAPNTPTIVDTLGELMAPLKNNPSNINWTQRIFISDQDFFPNMREADAFILIGGGYGTNLTGQTAAYLGKPVVALTAFGGAALQSFDLVLSAVYRDLNVRSPNIVALTQPWDKEPQKNRDAADKVVEFTGELHSALTRRLLPGERTLRNFLLLMPIALLLWVLILIGLPSMTAAIAYLLLLVLAAILGTGLRLLTLLQSRLAPAFTFSFVWTQLTLSILVAFGLMLVYLIGGISFTGNLIELGTEGNSAIATGLSVVGFAAGFLLPIARLRSQLSDAIAGQPGPASTSSNPS
jgi:hypothetical protein